MSHEFCRDAHADLRYQLKQAEEDTEHYAERAKMLEGLLETALRCIEDAAPGAFRNGNTDEAGRIDEGEVMTFGFVKRAYAALSDALASTGSPGKAHTDGSACGCPRADAGEAKCGAYSNALAAYCDLPGGHAGLCESAGDAFHRAPATKGESDGE